MPVPLPQEILSLNKGVSGLPQNKPAAPMEQGHARSFRVNMVLEHVTRLW